MSPPRLTRRTCFPEPQLGKALELLYALQALDDDARLTRLLGMYLAELPLEPQLGKALLVSGELGCVEEMLTVASYLQVQSVWESSRGRQRQLDEIKERFAVAEGDAVTALTFARSRGVTASPSATAKRKAGGAAGGGRANAPGEAPRLRTCSSRRARGRDGSTPSLRSTFTRRGVRRGSAAGREQLARHDISDASASSRRLPGEITRPCVGR